jgi:hypothetical protein
MKTKNNKVEGKTYTKAEKFSKPALFHAVKSYVGGKVDIKELTRLDGILGGRVLGLIRYECSDASF